MERELIGTGYAWGAAPARSGRYEFVSPGSAAAEAVARAFEERAPPAPARLTLAPEPARIYVEGGPEQFKNEVLSLLRASREMLPVPYIKQPEANINLQKDGTAKVKCGDTRAVLPGPTASDVVKQFGEWLPAAWQNDEAPVVRRCLSPQPGPVSISLRPPSLSGPIFRFRPFRGYTLGLIFHTRLGGAPGGEFDARENVHLVK